MPEIPIEIVNLAGRAGFSEGIINGNIEGNIKAGVTVSADVCHGINLGLDAELIGNILGNMDILFIGAQAKGELSAAAGARALVRLEPNLLEKMGLSIYIGAYARAMASGSLGVSLHSQFFSQQIQNHLDNFTADIFLIFLEEVEAKIGVWGRIAFSAMAEVNANVIFDIKRLSGGFEIGGGYKFGLEAGAGYDFYCNVGFKNLRRAVNRSSIRATSELKSYIQKSNIPQKSLLAECFDFSFPFIVLLSYDLGNKSVERGEFLSKEDVANVVFTNFNANLQRYAIDKIVESAVRQLTKEFSKIYYKIFGIQLSATEKIELKESVNSLVAILKKGDLRLTDLDIVIPEALNIIDILDDGAFDGFKKPLTLFWVSSIIGLEIKQLLRSVSSGVSSSSSFTGEARTSLQISRMPPAPDFVKEEIGDVLNETVIEIEVSQAIDYIMEIGLDSVEEEIFPEIEDFKDLFESTFNLTFGEIFADALMGLQGQGSFSSYKSYQAIKNLVKTTFLDQMILGEILPQITNSAENKNIYNYSKEVIKPSTYMVSDFVFKKLDDFLIRDLSSVSDLPQFVNSISSGCGVVVYNVLARNFAFFDQIINDFVLDNTFDGFENLGTRLSNDNDPMFVDCKSLLSQTFPNIHNLESHIEAIRQLLLDLTYGFKEITGPTVFTPARRNTLRVLKRDILLSMTGTIDYTGSTDPFVDKLLDCAFIPNKDLVLELSKELFAINIEAFSVFIEKIIPALGDFFLAVSLPDLRQIKENLINYIDELLMAAENALAAYNELSDMIDQQIIYLLEGFNTLIASFSTAFKEHIEQWGVTVKATIHYNQVLAITNADPPGTVRDGKLLAFENVTWPIESLILDTAINAGSAALTTAVNNLETSVDSTTDIALEIIILKQSVEDAITSGLLRLVLMPVHDMVTFLIDALIPDTLLEDIEDYLDDRRQQKDLQRQKLDSKIELTLLKEEKDRAYNKYSRNTFNALVNLEVLDPTEGFQFIYPKDVKMQMRLVHGNYDMISDPSSERIQVALNSIPQQVKVSDWTQSGDNMLFEKTIDQTKDGLNILEVSFIKGAEENGTIRKTIAFVVDASAPYKQANFLVSIDHNPKGSDVDLECVNITYTGVADLVLNNCLMQDKKRHKYFLPTVTLRQNDTLKVYTGGKPASDKIDKRRKNKLLHMGRRKAVWNNEGDTMYLSNADNVLICRYSYTP